MVKRVVITVALACLTIVGTNAFATPATKLLLTELIDTGTPREMVEIVNPGLTSVTLNSGITLGVDNGILAGAYFINDSNLSYWTVVNGTVTGGGSGDGIYYFPSGGTLAAGQIAIVVGESNAFFGDATVQAYLGAASAAAALANYLAQPGSPLVFETTDNSGALSPSVPNMIQATTTAGTLSFSDAGESAMLFYWDGQSDLVVDIDGVVTDGASTADDLVEKSGVAIDGPDFGVGTSTYGADSGNTIPNYISTGDIYHRGTMAEGQTGVTGNGIGGTDEFTENWSLTWTATTTASALTPGAVAAGVPVEVSRFSVE